jgi:hypothetical protein
MTDLIKRLHHHANGDCDMTPVGSTLLEAADHIEQTEAKLESALEMLRSLIDQAQHARFVLRELEGEQ